METSRRSPPGLQRCRRPIGRPGQFRPAHSKQCPRAGAFWRAPGGNAKVMTLSEPTFMDRETDSRFDVVVIGAGQAGLATGYVLKQEGRRFVIVDAGSIGSAWRGGRGECT